MISSPLSEFAVMGFEYGSSIVDPNTLHIWEAQFGDFFNGAQIIIDAFISSGEAKWGLQSNLVLLLPHGFDGTGPEHSSCRMERFLQLCNSPVSGMIDIKDCNMIVANPTTPSNYYHLLRRQMEIRKPLIVVGPKTLLRLPVAVSDISDLSNGKFEPLIATGMVSSKRLLFTSGKFYYDLQSKFPNDYIVRFEQINPFPFNELKEILTRNDIEYKELVWVQEEPENMGAYSFVAPRIKSLLGKEIKYVGRPASAAPATGISSRHKNEIESIFNQLLSF